MQRPKNKWRADHGTRALKTVSGIEASIARLGVEDLLDLHDIFAGDPGSPLDVMTVAEMQKRELKIP